MGRLVKVSASETKWGQDLQWESLGQIEDSVRLRDLDRSKDVVLYLNPGVS